jgi:hypothetical protein
VLVAHLAEHRRAVTRVAVAGGGAFFVSASADETCRARGPARPPPAAPQTRLHVDVAPCACRGGVLLQPQLPARNAVHSNNSIVQNVQQMRGKLTAGPGAQVWDTHRLTKDVSFRSRLTYTGQVRRPGTL